MPRSRKLTLEYEFLLAGGVILWRSVKQYPLITSFIMKVEFIACHVATSRVYSMDPTKSLITRLNERQMDDGDSFNPFRLLTHSNFTQHVTAGFMVHGSTFEWFYFVKCISFIYTYM